MCSMNFFNLCKHSSMTKLIFTGQTYLAHQPQKSSSKQISLPCLNVLLSKNELTTFTSWSTISDAHTEELKHLSKMVKE